MRPSRPRTGAQHGHGTERDMLALVASAVASSLLTACLMASPLLS